MRIRNALQHAPSAPLVMMVAVLAAVSADRTLLLAGSPSGPLASFGISRTWKDGSGRFAIDATLSQATSEEVQLRKVDGLVVTVPLAKLSDGDRGFVEAFLAAEQAMGGGSEPENPFAGGVAGGDRADDAAATAGAKPAAAGDIAFSKRDAAIDRSSPITVDSSGEFWKAGPCTPLETPPVRDANVRLPMQKDFWAATRLEIAGAEPQLLVSLYRQGRKPEENYSRFGRLILPDGKPEALGQSSEPWKIMAVSADARLGAAVRVVGFDKGNDLGIFQLTTEGMSPIYQFTAGEGSFGELHWVGFLGASRLATISQKQTLTVWDLAGTKALFRGKIEGALSASIGGAGELLAVPHSRGIVVFACQDFKQVGFLPLSSTAAPSVAFSPDGRRLAAYVPFEVRVYDLKDASISASIAVSESGGGLPLDWIGGNLLLARKLLIDVDRQLPAWTYESRAQGQAVRGSRLYSLFASDQGSSVLSLELPHEGARRAVTAANPTDLYVLQDGSEFAISANLGTLAGQQEEIVAAVRRKLEGQDWRSVPSSPNQVTIELTQGESQETEYRTFGFHTEKVQYRPWTHTIKFTVGGQEVHRFERVVGSGFMLSLKQGENAQQAVDRSVQPSASIFADALLPRRILKPDYRHGLGKSTIVENGLQ